MKKLLFIILTSISLAGSAFPVGQMAKFHAHIAIEKNGDLLITETFQTSDIGGLKNGVIYRDIPLTSIGPNGMGENVVLEVLEASIHVPGTDSNVLPIDRHMVENRSDGIRIYLDHLDTLLSTEDNTIRLQYRVKNAVGEVKKYKVLHWNVTGYAWRGGLSASVTLSLPDDQLFTKATAFTGYPGESGANYLRTELGRANIGFITTALLQVNEGLSIAVAWPARLTGKTATKPPTIWGDLGGYFVLLFLVGGLLTIYIYYTLICWRLRRKVLHQTIYPHYEPPKGYSPQALAFIRDMKYSDRLLSAALINIAVKGHIVIKKGLHYGYLLQCINTNIALLSPEEKCLHHVFFAKRNTFILDSINYKRVRRAITKFSAALHQEYDGIYFKRYRPPLYFGCLLSVFFALPFLLQHPLQMWAGIAIGFAAFLGAVVWERFAIPFRSRMMLPLLKKLCTIVIILLVLSWVLPFNITPTWFASPVQWISWILIVAYGVVNVVFAEHLKKPTKAGMALREKTLGFTMFLKATEKERMNFRNPPEKKTHFLKNTCRMHSRWVWNRRGQSNFMEF